MELKDSKTRTGRRYGCGLRDAYGIIAEKLRLRKDAMRSRNPTMSHAAIGKQAHVSSPIYLLMNDIPCRSRWKV